MNKVRYLTRLARVGTAFVVAASALLPVLSPSSASAYGLLDRREVKMSTSTLNTSASYFVNFRPSANGTVKSIALDFCLNSPILGDSCTGTVGTETPTITAATADTNGGAGIGNIGTGWTLAFTNSNHTATLTKAAGVAVTAGTDYYFTLNGVTNPTDMDSGTGGLQVGTFYARLLTFPNDTGSDYADNYTQTNLGANVPTDAGGLALSTASQITITAKVQERLAFCVYTGANCAAGGTTVTLGDTNGVLDPAGPFVDKNTKFDISTNAAYNAIVRVRGVTLTSGSNTITAIGATPATITTGGSEQFGFCAYTNSGPALTVDTKYDGASGAPTTECSGTSQSAGTGTTGGGNSAEFAFDTNGTTGTGSTYGETFATKAAGAVSTGRLAFGANVSNSTEAGIYTTTLTFIATGSY